MTAHGYSRCQLGQPCAATGRCHYSIVRTMTPWNHAPRVSFVCSKRGCLQLFAFCLHCCNSDGRFATLFEICGYDCCDSSIEICLGKAAYIFGVAERVLGVGEESWILAVLDGRNVAGYVRRWEGVVGGYQPWMWRGSCCGYHNRTFLRNCQNFEVIFAQLKGTQ